MGSSSLPSVRCHATAKGSGEQCKHQAIRGLSVCLSHGGATKRARAAGRRRVALAEAVAAGDRRHPAAVLLDVIHHADVIMQRAVVESTEDRAELLDAIERAGAFARDALRLQVDQRQLDLQRQRVEEDQAALTAACLRIALEASGLTPQMQARAEAELVRVLRRVDVEGPRAVLVEAVRLRTAQPALPPGATA